MYQTSLGNGNTSKLYTKNTRPEAETRVFSKCQMTQTATWLLVCCFEKANSKVVYVRMEKGPSAPERDTGEWEERWSCKLVKISASLPLCPTLAEERLVIAA